jgi:hypothetical protein
MKRRGLSKTTPFHVKKKLLEQNSVVLSDTVPPSSSPGRVVREGSKFNYFLLSSLTPPCHVLCQNPKPHASSWWETGGAVPCQPTWRRGRAAKPCSLCVAIGTPPLPLPYKYHPTPARTRGGQRERENREWREEKEKNEKERDRKKKKERKRGS